MILLKNIAKAYQVGDKRSGEAVPALRNVTLAFRDNEFVSVLGPSGCGKTTLLNILGGLDHYSDGDLIINGRSTKEYKDADWDTYRNHSIGFVFQSYNLIPHQSVLANVELALTLSGVSRAERRRRAIDALKKVGLGDQIHKRPNQMSGGQMQRVAIARALVNDPDILLADEPTGALDTTTSVQIMEILKEISHDKLILMVTHNPEIALTYSTRIVRLLDGRVVGDTQPYDPAQAEKDAADRIAQQRTRAARAKEERKRMSRREKKAAKRAERAKKKGKRSMSFATALMLSFQNLMTKKARTLLTSFAGSIGIIGIALILAMSTGIRAYVDAVQRDTLSSYPMTIEAETTDMTALLTTMAGGSDDGEGEEHEEGSVYSNPQMYALFNSIFAAETTTNNLTAFREFLIENMEKTEEGELGSLVSSIRYQYNVGMNTYVEQADGSYLSCDLGDGLKNNATQGSGNAGIYNMMAQYTETLNLWTELLPGRDDALISDMYAEQYDLLWGAWPESANEVVLMVDKNNEISDFAFYVLGMISAEDVQSILTSALKGEKIDLPSRKIDFEDIGALRFRVLSDAELYTDTDGDGIFVNSRDDEPMRTLLLGNATELRISGIIRPNEDASVGPSAAVFGYTSALTQKLIAAVENSPVMLAQTDEKNVNFDVLTGLPFEITEEIDPTDAYKAEQIRNYFTSLDSAAKTELYIKMLSVPDEAAMAAQLEQIMASYGTREAMEQLAADGYGMDIETIRSYLASYTDEQLHAMVEEQMRAMLTEQYATQAKARVEAIMTTPTEAELAGYTAQLLSQVGTDRTALTGFVMMDWKQHVSIDDMALMGYLAGLSDEQLYEAASAVAAKTAKQLYAANTSATSPEAYAKAAAAFDAYWQGSADDEAAMAALYDAWMPSTVSGSTLTEVLETLGAVSVEKPFAIHIYANDFEDKDAISELIAEYNKTVEEEDQISYTDYMALMMSGITNIINAITYGLIAFVAVSLVVSSIMIGIITYISVLERTKEIGILRAIGASKRDVSSVFNAETLIVGFTAGMIGIGSSLLLCIPINWIVHTLSGITAINAFLPTEACVILVLISMVLTWIAGLFPASMAAHKDPVEALRTE